MFFTTLDRIRANRPCQPGWEKLLRNLGKTHADKEPLSLLTILESNGIEDAIWALRAIDDCPEKRLFAVRCIRQIQHALTDRRSLNALDVAERHAVGEATDEDLAAARDAAGPPQGTPQGPPQGTPHGPPQGTPQGTFSGRILLIFFAHE